MTNPTNHTAELREARRAALQAAWDDTESLPPIVFSEAEADHLVAAFRALLPTQGTEYRRAIEDAAKVADKSAECCRAQGSLSSDREFVGATQEASDIADAIRALTPEADAGERS